jgi:predicted ATPase
MRHDSRGLSKDIGERGQRLAGFLAGLDSEKKDRLVRRISRFYPLSEIDTRRKRAGWIDLRVAETYRKSGRFSAAHMSDGFMRILALCAIPELPLEVSLVLLDEVEDGVEPHILPRLIDAVTRESQAQIVMTSHSPLLVNYFEPSEIVFLSRTADGRTISASADDIDIFRTGREFLGSGEIWANASLDAIGRGVARVDQGQAQTMDQDLPEIENVIAFMSNRS